MVKTISKEDFLKGNFRYPKSFIELKKSKHFYKRLVERGMFLDFIPSFVRITKDNVYSAKIINDKKICSITLTIKYSDNKNIYISLNPYTGLAKTIWFRRYGKRTIKKDNRQTI